MNISKKHPRSQEEFEPTYPSKSAFYGTYVIDLEVFDPQSIPGRSFGLPAPAVASLATSSTQQPQPHLETHPSSGPNLKPVPLDFLPTVASKPIPAKHVPWQPPYYFVVKRRFVDAWATPEEIKEQVRLWDLEPPCRTRSNHICDYPDV